jgi:hypothetical protein
MNCGMSTWLRSICCEERGCCQRSVIASKHRDHFRIAASNYFNLESGKVIGTRENEYSAFRTYGQGFLQFFPFESSR